MLDGFVLGSELFKLDELGFSFVGFVQAKFAYLLFFSFFSWYWFAFAWVS